MLVRTMVMSAASFPHQLICSRRSYLIPKTYSLAIEFAFPGSSGGFVSSRSFEAMAFYLNHTALLAANCSNGKLPEEKSL